MPSNSYEQETSKTEDCRRDALKFSAKMFTMFLIYFACLTAKNNQKCVLKNRKPSLKSDNDFYLNLQKLQQVILL